MPESRPRAHRDMRQDLEFPARWTPLAFERYFTAEEYERLAAGYPPGDMDDKWFIYLDQDTLWFHRNWTGRCIFKLRLLEREGEYVTTDVLLASYPPPPGPRPDPPPKRRGLFQHLTRLSVWARRPPPRPLDDAELLSEVIDRILLGKQTGW